jgi:uncharacterized protein (TIGR00730 family)
MQKDKTNKRPTIPQINDSNLIHESWKIFQVMAEFVEGFESLISIKPAVSVFGSARIAIDSEYGKLAQEIGKQLSDAGYSVVTGGGPGLMEAANIGAYSGKSLSVGLGIALPHESSTSYCHDITLKFRHFFTRKFMFVKYAAAYVVCPGGFGTLDELAEILTLTQTNKTKLIPIILVNRKFWEPLINWFETTLVDEKMINANDLKLFTIVEQPHEAVAAIQEFYKNDNLNPTNDEYPRVNEEL